MAIRAGLNRKLQRAKLLIVKSQGFPPSLERLDQNESRSVMRHHHRVTPEPITDRNTVYDGTQDRTPLAKVDLTPETECPSLILRHGVLLQGIW